MTVIHKQMFRYRVLIEWFSMYAADDLDDGEYRTMRIEKICMKMVCNRCGWRCGLRPVGSPGH